MYEKDIEGNIIGIYDMDIEGRVAKYEYDAWGRCKVCNADGSENTSETFIGNINAFRYKSYYYDSETRLYYLISRYYDPETGRFISPDHMGYMAEQMERINGCNLYAYCLNNPVMYSDPEGKLPIWLNLLIGGAVIIGLGILAVATAGAGTAAAAVAAGAFKGAVVGAAVGAAMGGATGAIDAVISGGDVLQGMAEGIASGFAGGAVSGAFGGAFGSLSGGVKTGTRLLAHKGMQAAGNVIISQVMYVANQVVHGKDTGPTGFVTESIGGFVSGIKYNSSFVVTFVITALSVFADWAASIADNLLT